MTRDQHVSTIADALDVLGDDELAVLATLTTRLVQGQAQYGQLRLATDTRHFVGEAAEENLDRCLYEAMHYRRRLQRGT